MLCLVAQLRLTLCNPVNCSLPDFSVRRFSKQEYWSELSCAPPGDLPNPGIEPRSPALQADSFVLFVCVCRQILYHLRHKGNPWNAKVGSQEIPGVTGKFGLGVQNEAGQRVLPREHTSHSKHPPPTA